MWGVMTKQIAILMLIGFSGLASAISVQERFFAAWWASGRATGGNVQSYTDTNGVTWVAHIFTGVGTNVFTVLGESLNVEVLVVAGGGGGASAQDAAGGGGGAGGLIFTNVTAIAGDHFIAVGAGGLGTKGITSNSYSEATSGNNSEAFGFIAIGGGRGGGRNVGAAGSGGSGGGGSGRALHIGGDGTPGQGFDGGDSQLGDANNGGGGGGGAATNGADAVLATLSGGDGGDGLYFAWAEQLGLGEGGYFAGGGGGGIRSAGGSSVVGYGGIGGGGDGHGRSSSSFDRTLRGMHGFANTGGGGGGRSSYPTLSTPYREPAGNGGSGIVVVRYRL